MVPDLADPFYSEFISQLRVAAGHDGYDVVIFDYGKDPELESRYLETLLSGCCDGVVAFITSFEHTWKIVSRFWQLQIPLIAVGTPDTRQTNYDLLNVDLAAGLSDVLHALRNRGKHHLSFIQEGMSANTLERVRSYVLDRWHEMPLDFDPEHDLYCVPSGSRSQAEDGYQVACRILRESPGTDAILTWHGVLAYGVQRAVLEHGKRVPEDIEIVACDHTWVTRFAPFPMISLDQQLDLLACEAWKMVRMRLLDKDWREPERRLIPAVADLESFS